MASWIVSTLAFFLLATVCLGIELGELHHISEAAIGGEELLEHAPELLHEHKPATSYQNFNLESKNPVPVLVKKEILHHEEEGFGHEGLEEGIGFKGF